MPNNCYHILSLIDSLPIIKSSGKRKGKVATQLTSKGCCSSKSMLYYGLKLHLFAFNRDSKLPFPESFVITPASANDLIVFKQNWSNIKNRTFFGDKIYIDLPYFDVLYKTFNFIMYTPIKEFKGKDQSLKNRFKAFYDLFSKTVLKMRPPIESFFIWLILKTDIQKTSKVCSTKGLIVQIFRRIAVAFCNL